MQTEMLISEKTKLDATVEKIKSTQVASILRVQQAIIRAVHEFMFQKGLVQVMPLMLSPITDPLNHSVVDATIDYAGQKWSVMKSMIFHKQLMMMNPDLAAIYIVSPNVRLELADRAHTGRHLFEFTQVDFEFKGKDAAFVMAFMEELIAFVFQFLNTQIPELIRSFRGGELLPTFAKFATYRTEELEAEYGEGYEHHKSMEATEPFWLLNHKREFYDKEDLAKLGTYLNYDIIWPEGFGEGLSGAEREHEYHQILKRMEETGTDKAMFKDYLALAEKGELQPSAGAGFGVERMTRFVCKLQDVCDATVFSRRPFDAALF